MVVEDDEWIVSGSGLLYPIGEVHNKIALAI
jgi:hypothetical protein